MVTILMRRFGLALTMILLGVVVASAATNYVQTWDYSDSSNADGSFMHCKQVTRSVGTTATRLACSVKLGHTLVITKFCAGIETLTSIQGMSVGIFDGTAEVAASTIEFADPGASLPDDCEDDNLSGGQLDADDEYCCQDVSISITSGTTWYVIINRLDGANDNLQDITLWVEGSETRD